MADFKWSTLDQHLCSLTVCSAVALSNHPRHHHGGIILKALQDFHLHLPCTFFAVNPQGKADCVFALCETSIMVVILSWAETACLCILCSSDMMSADSKCFAVPRLFSVCKILLSCCQLYTVQLSGNSACLPIFVMPAVNEFCCKLYTTYSISTWLRSRLPRRMPLQQRKLSFHLSFQPIDLS